MGRFRAFSLLEYMLCACAILSAYVMLASPVQAQSTSVDELYNLLNQTRAEHGLVTIARDSRLEQAATAKAQHMIEHNYWAHVAADGTTGWDFIHQQGVEYAHAGENLAKGFESSGDVHAAWLVSPEHLKNIVGNYDTVGIAGVAGVINGQQTWVVVSLFAEQAKAPVSQLATAPIPPEPSAPPTDTVYMPESLQKVLSSVAVLAGLSVAVKPFRPARSPRLTLQTS